MKHRILAFVCSIAAAFTASAQVPSLINYQGRLTDSNGAPVTGAKNFSISIYDAATGGNLLYEETIGAVTLDANGVYSFQFGSAGSSSTQVTETIGTTDGTTLTYSKALSNTPVVNNSITVTDGTNSWSQSVGNPGVGATATANTVAGFVIGATITNGGSGYTSAPAVTITGAGSGATATATLTDGVVTGITITSAGSGYTGSVTITIAPPVIPFRVDYSGGAITATYSTAPTAGQTISATYRYTTSAITAAISASSEQWLQLTVDGVNQVPRQRVLAVPFAQRAAVADTAVTASSALTANMATSVADGSITVEKFSPNALSEAVGPVGNVIYSRENRNDLIDQGFIQMNQFDNSSLTYAQGNTVNTERARDHSTVWTGTEMIIWGGSSAITSNYLNIGARYNPSNNTWTATSTTNAPSVRYGHTTIWTGTEMIVWGGVLTSNGTSTNTGGRYNPLTNTWTTTSTTNAPSSRNSHSAVWTGTEMIIWGGGGVNTGSRYNPASNTWTAISTTNAPSARGSHTAIWTGTEMIVWGGGAVSTGTNTGASYNPATNTWTTISTTNAPSSRIKHFAVWTGTEMIIFGGASDQISIRDGARYNPITDTWLSVNETNSNIFSSSSGTWTGDQLLVLTGDSCSFYDPVKDLWASLRPSSVRYKPIEDVSSKPIWVDGKVLLYSWVSGKVALIEPDYINVYINP